MYPLTFLSSFFFFNDTATTEIYTLSLHDALPISVLEQLLEHRRGPLDHLAGGDLAHQEIGQDADRWHAKSIDRKSTRLNSSHVRISYAVFCLKKKKINKTKNIDT